MKKIGGCAMRNIRNTITAVLFIMAILAATVCVHVGTAYAYTTYEGGDWGGMDFTPASGDVLSGTFTNIGRFIINAGVTVYAGSGDLSLFSSDALISGTMYGGTALSPSLYLTSQSDITMTSTGLLDQWVSVYLAVNSGTISLNGAITLINDPTLQLSTGPRTNPGATLTSVSYCCPSYGPDCI
jgi:hypothetical protein